MGATNPAVVGWVLGSVGLLLLVLGTVVYGRKRNAMRKRKAPSFVQAQTQTHKKSGSSEKDKEYGTLRTLAGRSRTDNLKANLNPTAYGGIPSGTGTRIGHGHGHGQGQFRGLSLISVHTPVHRVNFGDENARAISFPTITIARTPSDVRRNRRQNGNDNADANSVSDDEGLDSDIDSFTIVWDDIPDCLRFQMRNTRSFSLTQDRRALEEVLSLTNTLPDRVPEEPSTLLLSNDDFEQVSVDSLVALRAKHEIFHAVHAIRTRGRVIPASSPPNPGESLRKQITRRAFYDEMKLSEDRGVTTGHGRRIRWQEKQTLTGNAANAAAVATTTANKASSKRTRIFLQYQVPLYQDGVDTARVTQIHPLRIGSFRLIAVYYTLAKCSPYWSDDISLASKHNIDDFALNIGSDPWQPDRVADAYQAALQSGWILSLDMTSLSCASPTDAQALRSLVLKFAGHPNQLSQFTQHDELKGKITFVPSFFMDPNSFNEFVDGGGGVMDGDFNVLERSLASRINNRLPGIFGYLSFVGSYGFTWVIGVYLCTGRDEYYSSSIYIPRGFLRGSSDDTNSPNSNVASKQTTDANQQTQAKTIASTISSALSKFIGSTDGDLLHVKGLGLTGGSPSKRGNEMLLKEAKEMETTKYTWPSSLRGFFTHFGANTFNKNFLYTSDQHLYAKRWEALVNSSFPTNDSPSNHSTSASSKQSPGTTMTNHII
ncbi:hypothetical protein D9758_015123 [Tetrapyrgos nigripes]|uniref:Uncharacterized protein n=1 Tax=Tetrapyrgos nigripes TaxID=182062 RepID=A0A8H5C1S4_9AGAR|nr:hypothetical protein D9758_015123 [Tetrapyrgos nigripes]